LQVFYLDVVYVLHTCCKWMSQLFYLLRRMLLSSVSCCKCLCFRGMFKESWGHSPGAGERGTASRRPADGPRGAPEVLQTGCARPHPASRVPPARRERLGGRSSMHRRGAGRDRQESTTAIQWECCMFLLGCSVLSDGILFHRMSGRQQFHRGRHWASLFGVSIS
jgi:hypothetical protein